MKGLWWAQAGAAGRMGIPQRGQAGSPPGLGTDSLILCTNHAARGAGNCLARPAPQGALLEWAGVGTPGTWGGQTLTRGTGGKEVAPPTQTGSGTSLLGWGQRGP